MKFLFLIITVSIFSINTFAGVQCEGLRAIHAGTILYLNVKSHENSVLELYLVKGHRGGGSFRNMGSLKVEIIKFQDGTEQVVSDDRKIFIEISTQRDDHGRRVGRIESEQFNEDLFCSVWDDRN